MKNNARNFLWMLRVIFVVQVKADEMVAKKVITVAVGSKNPVKISAAKSAFSQIFPDATIEASGFDVVSGISAQPMSDEKSINGAPNRARKVLEQAKANFVVGIEGGLHKIG